MANRRMGQPLVTRQNGAVLGHLAAKGLNLCHALKQPPDLVCTSRAWMLCEACPLAAPAVLV